MIEDEKVFSRKSFSLMIMNRRIREPELSTIDAVIAVCEDRGIDPIDVKTLIDPTVKGLIEIEAIKLNMLEGSKSTLDDLLDGSV